MVWFNRQSRFLQLFMLVVPILNWVTEIIIRWANYDKKRGALRLFIGILVSLPFGILFGWVDFFFVLFTKKVCLQ